MNITILSDGDYGLIEHTLTNPMPILPPIGADITTQFPIQGELVTICATVKEVGIDYTTNTVNVWIDNIDEIA